MRRNDGGIYLMAAGLLLAFILYYLLVSLQARPVECDDVAVALEGDACISQASAGIVLSDPERSEKYCEIVSEPVIRDACNYEMVHDILVSYYIKNRGVPRGYAQLSEKLRSLCDKIGHDGLRSSCYDEIGRPFLFRSVIEGE
ncbi:MAG: hypothetical protein ABIH11_06130 [Candidatus Altiarchaeota archaeon]